MGWANLLNIPIICVYKEDSKVSGSLRAVADKFIGYKNCDDLINKLEMSLNEYSQYCLASKITSKPDTGLYLVPLLFQRNIHCD